MNTIYISRARPKKSTISIENRARNHHRKITKLKPSPSSQKDNTMPTTNNTSDTTAASSPPSPPVGEEPEESSGKKLEENNIEAVVEATSVVAGDAETSKEKTLADGTADAPVQNERKSKTLTLFDVRLLKNRSWEIKISNFHSLCCNF
jgi:hypothetical protein